MATSIEFRAAQKAALFDLSMLKQDNDQAGIKIIGLERLIAKTKAAMLEEDIAMVEKEIEQLANI